MDREQAIRLMQDLLRRMVDRKGSDLFITAGFPPAIKIDGEVRPQTDKVLAPEQSAVLVRSIMNDRQTREFDATKEANFAIAPPGIGRFRVSAFVQQGHTGCVIRQINATIPTIEELELPPILKDIVMSKRGIVIVVGATGSGKSTSLAAMVGYRNEKTRGHIVTIEDPVEYVHAHRGCVVTHREVGVDTDSWHTALKNTLRQAPDVIMIGEIRDRETAQSAVQASLTGHLVLATLHTNDSVSAVTRLLDMGIEPFLLSSSLLGALAQRLLRKLCAECRRQDAQGQWQPVGCPACGQTGYSGRTGVYELLALDDTLREAIHTGQGDRALRALARERGFRSMAEDGERWLADGTTSAAELARVTRES